MTKQCDHTFYNENTSGEGILRKCSKCNMKGFVWHEKAYSQEEFKKMYPPSSTLSSAPIADE